MRGLLEVLRIIATLFARNAKSSQAVDEKKEATKEIPQMKAEPRFKNDSKRLKEELVELSNRNKDLYDVLYAAAKYCKDNFNKDVVITMIYRTDQEQDSIYKDDAKYKVKKFKSPHQFYHAFDLRSSTFETDEIEKLVLFLNTTYNKNNYYNWTAKCHDVGLGDHFHVQYTKR